MVMYEAIIRRDDNKADLVLIVNTDEFAIKLAEDNPVEVKSVFNKLIKALKEEKFNFELKDTKEDLYFNICKEYIKQLNSELSSVYGQMKTYGIVQEINT
jgi:uncharacterized protein (DUF2344 family)